MYFWIKNTLFQFENYSFRNRPIDLPLTPSPYTFPPETVPQLEKRPVIPAEAGIQSRFYSRFESLDARLRGPRTVLVQGGHDEL